MKQFLDHGRVNMLHAKLIQLVHLSSSLPFKHQVYIQLSKGRSRVSLHANTFDMAKPMSSMLFLLVLLVVVEYSGWLHGVCRADDVLGTSKAE